MQVDNYTLLINKLDAFIRRYYLNSLVRGALYATAVVVGAFTLISFSEYAFYFSTTVRKLLFYGFFGMSVAAVLGWVVVPLLHYFRLGKLISHEKAATIIGNHFPNIKDKLLNILQLRNQHYYNTDNAALIEASIKQKSEELRPVPFVAAIDLAKNRQYLKYALPPLALLLGTLLVSPNIIKDSSARLYDNNTEYERPAPFLFSVTNNKLEVVQYEDFTLEVNVNGTAVPSDVFIDVDGFQYKMQKEKADKFTYTFSKVNDNQKFRLTANGFLSKPFELNVLKKPNIQAMKVALDYPAYTGRKDEMLDNVGDLILPAGTNITWVFNAGNADAMDVRYNYGRAASANALGGGAFSFGAKAMNDMRYTVFISNKYLHNADSVSYGITVQPDLSPQINVEQFKDSTNQKILFFGGEASDDYGISRLTVNYKIEGENVKNNAYQSLPLKGASGLATQFQYTLNVQQLGLQPGNKVTYYFEVWDKDAVHGAKSAKTSMMVYEVPTIKEFQKMEEQSNQEIKQDLMQSIKEAKELQSDIKKITDKFIQKKELNFQDKKELEKLLQKQKDLEKKMQEAKKNLEKNMENQPDFKSVDKSILEKQKQVQELFEKLNNPEMKKLMEEMQKMMDEMQKSQAMENLEKMGINNEELKKELERLEELFKQMELEQKMKETMENLEKLAKEEDKLSDKSKDGKDAAQDLKKEQDALNKKFDDLKKDMEAVDKKNEELEKPNKLEDTKEEQKGAEEDMKESSEELKKNEKQSASKKQKSAANKMKNAANKMKKGLDKMQKEKAEEDIRAMRQILENLMEVSFAQEKTMDEFASVNLTAPRYVELVQRQFKIKDDFKVIDDSLQALAKRNFKIKSFITEKVTQVNSGLRKSLDLLEDRQRNPAQVQQQRTMTAVNDLALMLSESMDQMQQQEAEGMPGAMCKKPSKGKGKKPSMSQMQQQLNDQMKKMGEKGKGKEGKKPGGKGGIGGQGGMSKEFAQAAAQQAAIRKRLQEMMQDQQQRGQGADKGMQDLMKQMDKTEEQLVNKQLTNDMQTRQQDIMTKLLEAEKAERERGQDEQRKAEVAQNRPAVPPAALQEYLKTRKAAIDQYHSVSPALRPYYKSLVEQYYNTLRGGKQPL